VATPQEIKSVQDLSGHLNQSPVVTASHAHVCVWFRGQPDSSWKLAPGVYRDDFPKKAEDERLKLERHLSQDFRAMSAGIRRGDEGEAELYFLQQHYRMRTRLLDWSNNALAGLYFAVSSHDDKDGELFMMDAYQLGPKQKGKYDNNKTQYDFEGIADTRHPVFQEALHVIFWWDNVKKFPAFISPVRPDFFDRRITLQRGCFTFHVPGREVLTASENDTLVSFLIPKKSKPDIRKELAILGIDAFSIYGDMEHLSERLKQAYGIP
jgi:FRG domain